MGQHDMHSVADLTWKGEAPAGSLKARILGAAKAHARLMREADAVVLCPPDCPAKHRHLEHAHTYGDMLRMKDAAEYEATLQRRYREGGDGPDVPHLLAKMGANKLHVARLAAAQLAPLEERLPLRAARYWWSQTKAPEGVRRPWLALLGEAGHGKSLAATSCLWKFAASYPWNSRPSGGKEARPAMFIRAAALSRPRMWDDVEADLFGCKLLVLDDIGADALHSHSEQKLAELLDERYGRGALTIITSKLSAADLARRLDLGRTDSKGHAWRRVVELALVLDGPYLRAGEALVPGVLWPARDRP